MKIACLKLIPQKENEPKKKKKNPILSNNFVHSKIILKTKMNKELKNEIGYHLAGPTRVRKVIEPMMS